jgi:general secretion pathway protein B
VSFILDALRKSEHERQRQTGPAMVEAAVAPPKPQSNRWATVAIALLLLNLVAVGVVLLWKSRDEPAAVAASSPAATTAPNPETVPPVAPPPVASPAPAPAPQATITRTLPEPAVAPAPVLRPAEPPPATGRRSSLEQEMSASTPPMDYEAAQAAARPPAGPSAVAPARRGSVVYESLPEAAPGATYAPPPAPAQQSAAASLPTADELTARGSLAEMRLELHVYSTRAQDRFVFVNGRRYREGDTTAEGATVVEITPGGAIMTAGGNRFLLSRD